MHSCSLLQGASFFKAFNPTVSYVTDLKKNQKSVLAI